jgi:hypothetical protein
MRDSVSAEYVGLTDYCRLHNDNIVYVANGGSNKRVQGNDFRGTAKEISVFENKLLRQAVKGLQSGIAQDPCRTRIVLSRTIFTDAGGSRDERFEWPR